MAAKAKTFILAITASLIAICMIISPRHSIQGALQGIQLWGNIVFPSLFPFFILAEMMFSLGIVHFIGVLFEPIMRPLFRVPGVGGFVLSMGIVSGFPAGAKFTARLKQEKQISAIEAERLVSFTNSSNPLFMSGAIAVGLFHNPSLAILIMASHYLGNLFVGFTMRFHGQKKEKFAKHKTSFSLSQAFHEMHIKRTIDRRPFGKKLSDAVNSAMQTMLMIGGFITLFSVLNNVLSYIHAIDFLAFIFANVLSLFSIPEELSVPFLAGLLEITNGSKLVSETENVSLLHQMMIISFILGFNGFSIQAQVASLLAEAQIRFLPYFAARILHGLYAVFFTFVLWHPLDKKYMFSYVPVSAPQQLHSQDFWIVFNSYGSLFTVIALSIFITLHFIRFKKQHPA